MNADDHPGPAEEPGQEREQRHQMVEADADDVDPVERDRLALGAVGARMRVCRCHVGHLYPEYPVPSQSAADSTIVPCDRHSIVDRASHRGAIDNRPVAGVRCDAGRDDHERHSGIRSRATTGCCKPSRRCPAAPISAPRSSSATSPRSGSATGSMSAASSELAEPLSFSDLRLGTQEVLIVRDETRRAQRLPQHLPASRLAALQPAAGAAEGAADHLPLPCMVLFAARRAGAGALQDAAGRFRQEGLSALSGGACGMARLRLRQSRRRARHDAGVELRSGLRRPRQLAARGAGVRSSLHAS